jgi:aspartate aminotransferase
MNIKLSARVQAVKPSATLAVDARAKALKAAGKDVIGLGAGEPDFDTPDHIKAAAIQAIQDGFTKYTAVDGTPSLKAAVVDKFKRENGFDFAPEQVLVSCGGKQSFFNLAQAVIDPGDEVVIPAPYWVSYPDMVLLAGGAPVLVHAGADQRFKISPAQLKAALNDKTKLVVINSPSNPTGMAYTVDELKALGAVLRDFPRALIATDDMYEHIRWESGPFVNILNVCPDLAPRTLVLNGVSKAYSMTGWRIGYAAGPLDVIKAMTKVQSQSSDDPAPCRPVSRHCLHRPDYRMRRWTLRAQADPADHARWPVLPVQVRPDPQPVRGQTGGAGAGVRRALRGRQVGLRSLRAIWHQGLQGPGTLPGGRHGDLPDPV